MSALNALYKRWRWAAGTVAAAAGIGGFFAVLTAQVPCVGLGECGEQSSQGAALAAQIPVVKLQPLQETASETPSLIARPSPVALARVDDDAFQAALRDEPSIVGAIALGRPNRGSLFNAAQLSNTDARWKLEVPEHSFGTEETVRGIEAAIAEVHRLFPNTPPLSIGHLSSKQGGWLRPHRSHQNGRDVDLGFFYSDGSPWYRKATEENLDVPRTWALLSGLERAAGLEYAFVDQSLHNALRKHAESIGESAEFLQHMFDGPLPIRGPTIRHERGHLTHLHVRFASPIAVENAQRVRAFAGKGARNSGVLAQVLNQRQAKQRFVADRRVSKSRSSRRGKTVGARTKML